MRHKVEGKRCYYFAVREVYYGKSGKVVCWTESPIKLTGKEVKDIVDDVNVILADLKSGQRILNYDKKRP